MGVLVKPMTEQGGTWYDPTSAEAERRWSVIVPLAPTEALTSATTYMLREGFSLSTRTETSATFTRYEEPSFAVGCILMFFFFLPGLLYFILAGGERHVTLQLVPEEGGSRVVLGGDSRVGRITLRQWAAALLQPQP